MASHHTACAEHPPWRPPGAPDGTPPGPAALTVAGPYLLGARLGAGGMGEVFLSHTQAGRAVAVKVAWPRIAQDPGFRARFLGEVDAARRVGGFHTAPVVDADPDAERPWMATEYVAGPSLLEAVTACGPLPVDLVRLLGAGLAEGLAAVHAAGVVHRDLTPSNVLLADDGPRVIDFGISRALEATRPATGQVVGTPAYMSPEQAQGHGTSPASDVFSLGCVLGYATTGRSLFGSGRARAILYRVVHEEADLSDVPGSLAPLIASCLAKSPDARPTVAEVLARMTDVHDDAVRWQLPPALASMADERDLATQTSEHGAAQASEDRAAQASEDGATQVVDRPGATIPVRDRVVARRRPGSRRSLVRLGIGVSALAVVAAAAITIGRLSDAAEAPAQAASTTPTATASPSLDSPDPVLPQTETTPFDMTDRRDRHVLEIAVTGASPSAPVRVNYAGLVDVGSGEDIEPEELAPENKEWVTATSDWTERRVFDGRLIQLTVFAEGSSADLTCRITHDDDVVSQETRSLDDGTQCSVIDAYYQELRDEST